MRGQRKDCGSFPHSDPMVRYPTREKLRTVLLRIRCSITGIPNARTPVKLPAFFRECQRYPTPRPTAKSPARRLACRALKSGTPEETRTPNLLIRSQTLYPIELRVLCRALRRGREESRTHPEVSRNSMTENRQKRIFAIRFRRRRSKPSRRPSVQPRLFLIPRRTPRHLLRNPKYFPPL